MRVPQTIQEQYAKTGIVPEGYVEFAGGLISANTTGKGHPSKGAFKFGDDLIEVDFKNLPEDHMIPEVIAAQRDYIRYVLVEKLRKIYR